jgi:hypothetical protein
MTVAIAVVAWGWNFPNGRRVSCTDRQICPWQWGGKTLKQKLSKYFCDVLYAKGSFRVIWRESQKSARERTGIGRTLRHHHDRPPGAALEKGFVGGLLVWYSTCTGFWGLLFDHGSPSLVLCKYGVLRTANKCLLR